MNTNREENPTSREREKKKEQKFKEAFAEHPVLKELKMEQNQNHTVVREQFFEPSNF
ncbi:uncharacterized protein G2W53_037993 [Senna tora]|uniref:Uncharacterized protein n=1 Tax=Senna tora TaxID=362788 RepID=A0A834SR50_9FABA|nr:uncharacterized protein G2W53_037993 [Senna tora]